MRDKFLKNTMGPSSSAGLLVVPSIPPLAWWTALSIAALPEGCAPGATADRPRREYLCRKICRCDANNGGDSQDHANAVRHLLRGGGSERSDPAWPDPIDDCGAPESGHVPDPPRLLQGPLCRRKPAVQIELHHEGDCNPKAPARSMPFPMRPWG